MDLRHWSHLVALADERHFARAAERVHLSQPAFSRSIQTLERDAGLRLFDREGGVVRPTPAGEFLIERARRLLFEARCVQRDIALYRDSRLGDTAFGVGPFPAATLAPRVLGTLRREHPDVGLRVEVSNWELLLERLRSEDIEFFVADVRSLPDDPALEIESLGHQLGRFYVRTGHPLRGKALALSAVWAYGVAATRLPLGLKVQLGALLGLPKGQWPALALECDDLPVLRAAAMATDTVLATTDAAVQADVKARILRPLDVAALPPLFAEMGVARLRHRTPSPMARIALECFKQVAAEVNRPPGAAAAAPTAGSPPPPPARRPRRSTAARR